MWLCIAGMCEIGMTRWCFLEDLMWKDPLVRRVFDRAFQEAGSDSEARMRILASHVFIHFWAYFAFGFSDPKTFKITYVKILIFSAIAIAELN